MDPAPFMFDQLGPEAQVFVFVALIVVSVVVLFAQLLLVWLDSL